MPATTSGENPWVWDLTPHILVSWVRIPAGSPSPLLADDPEIHSRRERATMTDMEADQPRRIVGCQP